MKDSSKKHRYVRVILFTACVLWISVLNIYPQYTDLFDETVTPRMRVMIDNDFGGDPDGLFQLVHHLLSPSVEIRGIIGSKHYDTGFFDFLGTASFACSRINEVLDVMRLTRNFPVYEGANASLTGTGTPIMSQAAKAIVDEAMREGDLAPLFILCGAGLTNIASAYLIEPEIAERVTLIWIGGPEYEGLAISPPNVKNPEYNLGIDIKASQVIYNISEIPIWQVARNVYRQALFSHAELISKVQDKGSVGKFLTGELEDLMKKTHGWLGETYILGDNPLVLLTALQSPWEPDPSSSKYLIMPVPYINDMGNYEESRSGREIRVYTDLDNRLMIDDLIAKLFLFSKQEN